MVVIRAEKTTQNKDDFRVLMAGIFITILLIVAKPYFVAFMESDDPIECFRASQLEGDTWTS